MPVLLLFICPVTQGKTVNQLSRLSLCPRTANKQLKHDMNSSNLEQITPYKARTTCALRTHDTSFQHGHQLNEVSKSHLIWRAPLFKSKPNLLLRVRTKLECSLSMTMTIQLEKLWFFSPHLSNTSSATAASTGLTSQYSQQMKWRRRGQFEKQPIPLT